jgi:hypothetical protein
VEDGGVGVADGEFPRFRLGSLGGADQDVDTGAVDKRKLGEVENGVDVACASPAPAPSYERGCQSTDRTQAEYRIHVTARAAYLASHSLQFANSVHAAHPDTQGRIAAQGGS